MAVSCRLVLGALRSGSKTNSGNWRCRMSWSVGCTQGVVMCVAALKTEGRGRNPVSTDKKIEKLCVLTATREARFQNRVGNFAHRHAEVLVEPMD
jgi:hypothetical protein